MMQVVIYTKDNDIVCEHARQLLNHYHLKFEERNVDDNWTRKNMMTQLGQVRLPLIVINGLMLDKFSDVKTHVRELLK